jgi:hypothetical protein
MRPIQKGLDIVKMSHGAKLFQYGGSFGQNSFCLSYCLRRCVFVKGSPLNLQKSCSFSTNALLKKVWNLTASTEKRNSNYTSKELECTLSQFWRVRLPFILKCKAYGNVCGAKNVRVKFSLQRFWETSYAPINSSRILQQFLSSSTQKYM